MYTLSKIADARVDAAANIARKFVKAVNNQQRISDSDAVANRIAKKYGVEDGQPDNEKPGPGEDGSQLKKVSMRLDSLGKNTSPSNIGNGLDAPMPQTNYAKSTLNNAYNTRLNNRQYNELGARMRSENRLGNSSSNSSSSSSTNSSTSTTSGLNSGLTTTLTTTSISGYR